MDNAGEHSTWRKYYINVCRPLNPVPGCDRYTSACQMKYENNQVSLLPLSSCAAYGAHTLLGGGGYFGIPRSKQAWLLHRNQGISVNSPAPAVTVVSQFRCAERLGVGDF